MSVTADAGVTAGDPAGDPGAAPTSGLDWACGLLWGGDAVRSRRGGPVPAGFHPAESYLVLPGAANPRLLVPLASRRAAAAALARNHDATSKRSRAVKATLGAGLRVGLTPRLLRDRVDVDVADRLAPADLPAALLTEHLRKVFGRRDLAVAVILGVPRLNRKPVLQVLSAGGEVLGYVKAAWNDLTRGLVRNEAGVLADLGRTPPETFTAPDLIHHGEWGALELLAASALPNALKPREAQVFDPPVPVVAEVARLGGLSRAALGESAYWAGVRERLAARPAGDGLLAGVVDHVEARHGDVELPFGTWHGDFTPWNMARLEEGIFVWDWERAGAAPVGLDLLHFLFQSVCRFEGRNPHQAVEICRRRTPALLPLLDVPASAEAALWTVYRMELLFRYDEARLAGVLERRSRIHAGILETFATEMEAR